MVMPQPEMQPESQTNQPAVQDRVAGQLDELGMYLLRPMAAPSAYDTESELSRRIRKSAYERLPKQLTQDEVSTFARAIYSLALSPTASAEIGSSEPEARKTTIRALHWLGSVSVNRGDKVSAGNVARSLRTDHGISGKMAALSLWYEKSFKA